MTAWTRSDVIAQVIRNLGAEGNTSISDEDSDKVDKIIRPVCESLSRRNIYTFQDYGSLGPTDGAFEEEAVIDLCHCLAWAVAPSFGMAGDQNLERLARQAENNLEIIAAPIRVKPALSIEQSLQPPRPRGTYTGT